MADFKELGEQLELEEIESPGGIADPHIYSQLLAIYLLEDNLTSAKFLWKRIPLIVKRSHAEISQVWDVGLKLWQRDFKGVHQYLQKEWSDPLKPIMAALSDAIRKRALLLVQRAYSSISVDNLAGLLGMSVREAIDAVVAEGWRADPDTRMVVPKLAVPMELAAVPSERQLARLTDFATFLEN